MQFIKLLEDLQYNYSWQHCHNYPFQNYIYFLLLCLHTASAPLCRFSSECSDTLAHREAVLCCSHADQRQRQTDCKKPAFYRVITNYRINRVARVHKADLFTQTRSICFRMTRWTLSTNHSDVHCSHLSSFPALPISDNVDMLQGRSTDWIKYVWTCFLNIWNIFTGKTEQGRNPAFNTQGDVVQKVKYTCRSNNDIHGLMGVPQIGKQVERQ